MWERLYLCCFLLIVYISIYKHIMAVPQTQKRKRCPTGSHRNPLDNTCRQLQPCYVFSEEQMYQRVKHQIQHALEHAPTASTEYARGLTQITGSITARNLPLAHMRNTKHKENIKSGTFNRVFITNTRKKCADKTQYPKYVTRVTKNPITTEPKMRQLLQEARVIANMSIHGISPKVFDMIYQPDQTFAVIMEYFPYDLLSFFQTTTKLSAAHTHNVYDQIYNQATNLLYRIAETGAFCIDIKMENTLIRVIPPQKRQIEPVAPTVELRFIDFDWRCLIELTPDQERLIKKCARSDPRLTKTDVIFYLMYALYILHLKKVSKYFIKTPLLISACIATRLPDIMIKVPDYMLMVHHYSLFESAGTDRQTCVQIVNTVFRTTA